MNWTATSAVRRKIFISYHKADSEEVNLFLRTFAIPSGTFLARGIGSGMAGDIVNSTNTEYVMSRIRALYLGDSTVTIVMLGNCTWSRRYVDWELQSSLRSGETVTPNGVLGVKLPSYNSGPYPDRLNSNLLSEGHKRAGKTDCYARAIAWPSSADELRNSIEDAFRARTQRAHLINNPRERFQNNRDCGHSWH